MKRVWGRGEVYTGFERGNLREGGHFKNPELDGKIILKWIFENFNGKA
jgi:hypothetical protein